MQDVLGIALAGVLTGTPLYGSVGTHVVTLAHEGGHALLSGMSGGRVRRIRVERDGRGSTLASYGYGYSTASSLAGYLTPPAVGLGAVVLAHSGRDDAALVALLVGLVLVVLSVRNLFGLMAGALLIGGLYVTLHHTAGPTQDLVLLVVGWTLLLGSLRDTLTGLRDGLGDAEDLRREVGLPAVIWVVLFAAGAGAAVYCAAWLTVTRW